MDTQPKPSPAAVAAHNRENRNEKPEVRKLSTGYRVRIIPVSTALIVDAQNQVEEPKPPMWHNEDMDRDEPNYNDPGYKRAMKKYSDQRGEAALNALLLFGLELVDPLPDDNRWIKKLRHLEKRGQLDLSEYDLEDEFDRELVFLRYVATTATDLEEIGIASGIRQAETRRARGIFPGDEEGPADRDAQDQGGGQSPD